MQQGLRAVEQGRAIRTVTARERAYLDAVPHLYVDCAHISQPDRPLIISETSTVKAIAVASGYADSPVTSATFTIKPGAISTTTTLTASSNPSNLGDQVRFTATVTAASGPPPTGLVIFKNGSVVLGSARLLDGTASLITANLALDGNAIAAIFTGSTTDAVSAATLTQEVQ
ncbi:Cell surface protein [Acidisarcina polymorpha]|uniref:Cell surface protein n=1 Tax=Acidisarcina polymorpha TaxID=2211140 RepID=A0A2Z5FV68_9BACT|nr:Ig-like domain repeat protein [Acidisarcina polymorpha]AXC10306.1 Cell surface protein [Acidisarcina polymorpha]